MRVIQKGPCPGMKQGRKSDLGTQVFGVPAELQEGLARRLEKKRVDHFLISQGDGPQGLRQREDDMKIADGKKICFSALQPALFFQKLALGTVAVPAGVRYLRQSRRPANSGAPQRGLEVFCRPFSCTLGPRMPGKKKQYDDHALSKNRYEGWLYAIFNEGYASGHLEAQSRDCQTLGVPRQSQGFTQMKLSQVLTPQAFYNGPNGIVPVLTISIQFSPNILIIHVYI